MSSTPGRGGGGGTGRVVVTRIRATKPMQCNYYGLLWSLHTTTKRSPYTAMKSLGDATKDPTCGN